jgi:hypothetical protein
VNLRVDVSLKFGLQGVSHFQSAGKGCVSDKSPQRQLWPGLVGPAECKLYLRVSELEATGSGAL